MHFMKKRRKKTRADTEKVAIPNGIFICSWRWFEWCAYADALLKE